jgi:hypothetical protein
MRIIHFILLVACGCYEGNTTNRDKTTNDTATPPENPVCYRDADLDGYGNLADPHDEFVACPDGYVLDHTDCDDSDATINPAAEEICDNIDQNCDGMVDEGVTSEFYADEDGDGFGDFSETIEACAAPSGFVEDNTDCNDADPRVNPGSAEVCDGLDNDCDGTVDNDDAVDALIWYPDIDTDGYGNFAFPRSACLQPSGFVNDSTDCDDLNSTVYPGAEEICDGVDQDCDGALDNGVTTEFYADEDGDGFGDFNETIEACTAPSGFVEDATDCNDAEANSFPGNQEVCDGLDNDCNGVVDDNAIDATTWYVDEDADGYGLETVAATACEAPEGYTTLVGDCDDINADANPGMTEVCDGVDNDCDGTSDENDALDAAIWYEDRDGDGYGNGTVSTASCEQPSGFVELDGDCDDTNAWFNPGAVEDDCTDPNDYNCDGSVGYADNDGDGFAACEECDDSNAATFPGSTEFCDGADNDCDGLIDDGSEDAPTWYHDSDLDGYGDSAYPIDGLCEAPAGYVSDATDCDDADASTYSGADEFCDGVDNDCDGAVDEDDAADTTTWYFDADSDSFGDVSQFFQACQAPSGFVSDATDCNDTDSSVHPDADEYCNSVDDDCDGTVDEDIVWRVWYTDLDLDGYGDDLTATSSCSPMDEEVLVGSDCDDTNGSVHPDAEEVCDDGVDQDCDGADEVCPEPEPEPAADADGDGYSTILDCDDADAAVNPAATEVCGDGLDNDCSGGDLDCDDVDWDSDGYSVNTGDCDDEDAAISPAASEVCTDGVDNDCDGLFDLLDTACVYLVDYDGDGYAFSIDCDESDADINPGAEDIAYDGVDQDCDGADLTDVDGDGYSYETDCDETDDSVHPGAEEVCGDGVDQNCDGLDDICTPVDGDGDGWLEADGDCDDSDSRSYPGATEICYDGADNDCDGLVDDLCPAWDEDGDGYSAILDCDDSDPSIHPGAEEIAYDGVDQDCDGADLTDLDGDGYAADVDCDDSDSSVYPNADEYCDGVDNDCDGAVDEAASLDADIWFADMDGDGYGDPAVSVPACSQPLDFVSDSTDCDDINDTVYPDAEEVCGDGVDQDCDGGDTMCAGNIACAMNGDILEATITGDVAAGLMTPISSVNSIGLVSWESGGSSVMGYLGATAGHWFQVYPASDFTPYAATGTDPCEWPGDFDGVTCQWFDLQVWSASGNCAVVDDGLGGLVVQYSP